MVTELPMRSFGLADTNSCLGVCPLNHSIEVFLKNEDIVAEICLLSLLSSAKLPAVKKWTASSEARNCDIFVVDVRALIFRI